MGATSNQPFQLSFNRGLKVDFQGSRVTSDSGLLLVRELDACLGLSALIAENVMAEQVGPSRGVAATLALARYQSLSWWQREVAQVDS